MNEKFSFTNLLLQITFRQCTCGERHECIDLFEQHIAGKDKILSLYPHTTIPWGVSIQTITRTVPIAACPKCIDKINAISRPTISEQEWRLAIERKAKEAALAKKPPPKNHLPSLEELGF